MSTQATRSGRLGTAAKTFFLFLGSLLFTALIIEAGFRLAGYNFPLITRYDPHTGFTNGANIAGWTKTESIEHVKLDRHGLRMPDDAAEDASTSLRKPPDTFRIAVLGDSYTESFYVPFEESFPRVLERGLNACSGSTRRIEVLNFGVSGYSNVQELLTFRHKAKQFGPDLVLLVVHAENDLRNNFRKHEQNPFIPYAEFRSGRLHIDESFRDDPAFQSKLRWSNLRNDLANHSRALQFATAAIGRWRQGIWHDERVRQMPIAEPAPIATTGRAAPSVTAVRPSAPEPSIADMDALFRPDAPSPPLYGNPEIFPPARISDEILWRLAEAVFLQLRDEVRDAGAPLWITSTATNLAIAPDRAARDAFIAGHGFTEIDYSQRRLSRFAAAAGIGYLPLASALRDYAEKTGTDLEWFEQRGGIRGHWIAAGHRIVGQELARGLCDAGILRTAR